MFNMQIINTSVVSHCIMSFRKDLNDFFGKQREWKSSQPSKCLYWCNDINAKTNLNLRFARKVTLSNFHYAV